MSSEEGQKTSYNVVTSPRSTAGSKWYATNGVITQFDAKWNDKYHRDVQQGDISYWSDLSGNNHDGMLKSFDGNASSGWDGT